MLVGDLQGAAQVGTLCALGTLCLDHEDHRRQLAEARVLAQIVRALDDPDAQARHIFAWLR